MLLGWLKRLKPTLKHTSEPVLTIELFKLDKATFKKRQLWEQTNQMQVTMVKKLKDWSSDKKYTKWWVSETKKAEETNKAFKRGAQLLHLKTIIISLGPVCFISTIKKEGKRVSSKKCTAFQEKCWNATFKMNVAPKKQAQQPERNEKDNKWDRAKKRERGRLPKSRSIDWAVQKEALWEKGTKLNSA